jgi:hypothetical protein
LQADHDLYDDIGSHGSELPSRQQSPVSNQQPSNNHQPSDLTGLLHGLLPTPDPAEKANVAASTSGREISAQDALIAIANALQLPQEKHGPAHVLAAAQACFQGAETLKQRLQEEQAKHLSSQVQVRF